MTVPLPEFNTYYTHFADEVSRLASSVVIQNDTSPSLSGGDDYAPETLFDDNPAKVAKIEDTNGAWIFTYTSKQVIYVAGLIHHTFDETEGGSPAQSVRLEGNNTNVWTNPSFVGVFTIPEWFSEGTRRWPNNAWLDLSTVSGFDPTGFLYWRLVIEGNSQNIQLGQTIFSKVKRQFEPEDLQWGIRILPNKPIIESETAFGISTIYPRGTTIWGLEGRHHLISDSLAMGLERHWYDVEGRARPWLLIPSGPGLNDRCYMVRYAMTDRQAEWNWSDQHNVRLLVREAGRGLRPGV